MSKVLPVGNPAAARRVLIDDAQAAGEFLGEQRPDRRAGSHRCASGGGEHVGGVAAHVQPPTQQVDDFVDAVVVLMTGQLGSLPMLSSMAASNVPRRHGWVPAGCGEIEARLPSAKRWNVAA